MSSVFDVLWKVFCFSIQVVVMRAFRFSFVFVVFCFLMFFQCFFDCFRRQATISHYLSGVLVVIFVYVVDAM